MAVNAHFTRPPLRNQLLYASGSMAFTMLERMLILYIPFFYLPPQELGMGNLMPSGTYLGLLTALGGALLLGRLFDALADPVIAHLSDNSQSPRGRRKVFLLISALPLAVLCALAFHPPSLGESVMNGVWLALTLGGFYLFFTAFVNPYLALIPELVAGNDRRIDLSTFMAGFGLLGMVLVTIAFPALVTQLQQGGMDLRRSYQLVATGSACLAAVFLYVPTRSFRERHPIPSQALTRLSIGKSLRRTLAIRPFRIFLLAEICLQFAMNIMTLGLLYYTVVIFRRDPAFLVVISAIIMGTALLSFPFVNVLAKRKGKKRVMCAGMLILTVASVGIFALSGNMTGAAFYLALALLALAGIPVAILIILINPTIADMARADALQTGMHREAMFFGVRAIPLKLSIAGAGIVFGYLLAQFGKDMANPLGIQLSLLVVAIASSLAYLAFRQYPEEEVQAWLSEGEKKGP